MATETKKPSVAAEPSIPVESVTAVCGIVMPISAIDDCTEAHWVDVLGILSDAVRDAGYKPNIVSNADEAGIIQKRIIQNLYDNEIVICDVSGKNPNVMFELGIRLAFDKPTIVIKDDRTDYSFDTSPIEHVSYPRDLRFHKIVEFKKRLSEKIIATVSVSKNDPNYTSFLKHFGEFKVASLEQKEVSPQEYILEEILDIKRSLRRLEIRPRNGISGRMRDYSPEGNICLNGYDDASILKARQIAKDHPAARAVFIRDVGNHQHLIIDVDRSYPEGEREIRSELRRQLGHGPIKTTD